MTDGIAIVRTDGLTVVTLDRSRALNALTTEMVAGIKECVEDSDGHVLIRSAHPTTFCAGGDIRAVREYAMAGDFEPVEEFFATEYAMNLAIAEASPGVVSVVDGICLGGGLGIAGHSAVHVVTERASLAMPESAIGFFPDVGASRLLAGSPGHVGLYLGMTGVRIGAHDAVYAGLATHIVASADLPEFVEQTRRRGVRAALGRFARALDLDACALHRHRSDIDRCFSADSVHGVLDLVAETENAWGEATSTLLRGASPQSVGTAFALIRRAGGSSLSESLAVDLKVAMAMARTADFLEGVGAKLVDRNRSPVWTSTYDQVDLATTGAHG